MSTIIAIVLILLVAVLALHAWLGQGEDLTVHDHPVEAGGGESFSNPNGPSTGHQGVVAAFEARGDEVPRGSPRGLIRYSSQVMNGVPFSASSILYAKPVLSSMAALTFLFFGQYYARGQFLVLIVAW